MMRRIVWTTLGAALIVVGITAAWTQTRTWRGGHGPFWFHHGPMGFVAHELDLSETQKSQIKTIWEGERPNISVLVREFASEQKEMDAHHIPGRRSRRGQDARIFQRGKVRRWQSFSRRRKSLRARSTPRF